MCFRVRAVVLIGVIAGVFAPVSFGRQAAGLDAATILAKASAALTGGAPVTTAVQTGTVAYSAGSDEETGPVELETADYFDSKLLMHLSGGDRLEILHQNAGAWAGADAVRHAQAMHNALTSAPWFFPALLVNGWIADASFSVTSVGLEQRNGISVQHLHCVRVLAGQADATTAAMIQTATAMELYLDNATFLPIALEYNAHPDANELQNIPVRIEYGSYGAAGSGNTPYHIQKYLQGTLLLDIAVSEVALNVTIPASEFSLQ